MSYSRMYAHIVWGTRDRAPLITAEVAQFLVRFLPLVAEEEKAAVLAGGMVASHIHLLLRVSHETDIPKLLQRMKGGSARISTRDNIGMLRWAKGYSLTSLGPNAVPAVVAYLRAQPKRHPAEVIKGWESGFFSLIPEPRP